MSIKRFKGFKGVCAFAQLGEIQFCILAPNNTQLKTLWAALMKESGALEEDACQKAILIEASLLPENAAKPTQPTEIIEA